MGSPQHMMSQASAHPHTFSTETSRPHTEHSYPAPTFNGFFGEAFFTVFFAAVVTFLEAAGFFGETFAFPDALVFLGAVLLIAISFLLEIDLFKLYQIKMDLQEAVAR